MTSAVNIQLALPDVPETERLAARLAAGCAAGDCIALSGELGAGKTTFARAFIRALAGAVEVTSPTFTLVQTYDAPTPLWHADLYRLEHARELAELGLEEALERGILLVEWPEIAEGHLPEDRLRLRLESGEGGRVLRCNAPARWYTCLQQAGWIA